MMGPRILAFLRVLAVAVTATLAIIFALKLISLWTLLAVFAVALALGLWLRSRRVCCYLCRGSVVEGSGVFWIKGRRRLVCMRCLKINGLESFGWTPPVVAEDERKS